MMEMQSRNKHEYNRKQMQQKQVTVQEVLENYPDFVINYSERERGSYEPDTVCQGNTARCKEIIGNLREF